MSVPLEDYALLGDCRGAALVSKQGAVDWWCAPRFDSPACLAALLGDRDHGHWTIAPAVPVVSVTRTYRDETLVLETVLETEAGTVALIECMLFDDTDDHVPQLVRVVEGRAGSVPMQMELVLRFDYGARVPWVTREASALQAIAGSEVVRLYTPVRAVGRDLRTHAHFDVRAGEHVPFVLTHAASHLPEPTPVEAPEAIARTERTWSAWSARSTYRGAYQKYVQRSLLVLKALTYRPTGGIVAAPTCSLPEHLGGQRNWDYRFCWIRDATISLYALLLTGHDDEAVAWRNWLLRAVAGSSEQVQVLYGIGGERRVPELELPWLPGYAGSHPVHAGNDAHTQLQLDVYGELMNAMYQCRAAGIENEVSWPRERRLLAYLEDAWRQPDQGIWEVRGERLHFTHSKIMAWVAFDRAIRSIDRFGRQGPRARWVAVRDAIHEDVCAHGFSSKRNAFVQSYGSESLDASLLLMPLVGFLPPDDARVRGTVAAIERELMIDDTLVRRYTNKLDDLPAGEGAFLACSFWLVSNRVMQGRVEEARALFERLLALTNDVGLLAEEVDPVNRCQIGNFPQAFSHLAIVDAAMSLARTDQSPHTHRTHPQHERRESQPPR